MHLVGLINYLYSFRMQRTISFLKITIASVIREKPPITPTNLIKKDLTYSSETHFKNSHLF